MNDTKRRNGSIIKLFQKYIRPIIRKCGVDLVRYKKDLNFPLDFDELDIRIYKAVEDYTMTNVERVHAIIQTVQYIVKNKIDGDLVECGVWKGGSIMAMVLTLKELRDMSREIYLYDTFSGMSEPTSVDIWYNGKSFQKEYYHRKISKDFIDWCYASLEEVKSNISRTGYPKDKFHFIKGKVEDTLPGNVPQKIALLRLDTDWYESTKHELIHLFPLLSHKGVLIIDDYGRFQGAKKAVNEYILENKLCILLNRIDDTCRIGVKV